MADFVDSSWVVSSCLKSGCGVGLGEGGESEIRATLLECPDFQNEYILYERVGTLLLIDLNQSEVT